MHIKFLTILFIILNWNIYGQKMNNYDFVLKKQILTGKADNELGFRKSNLKRGGLPGPATMFIDSNFIYIPDRINKRVAIFDLDMNFIENIRDVGTNKFSYSTSIKKYNNGSFLYYTNGLNCLDINFSTVFKIPRKELPKSIYNYKRYYVIDNTVFFKNDDNILLSYDSIGTLNDLEHTKNIIENIESQINLYENMLPVEVLENLKDKVKKLNGILIGDNFYTTFLKDLFNYFTTISEIIPLEVKDELFNVPEKDFHHAYIKEAKYVGTDNSGNTYWDCMIFNLNKDTKDQAIVVCSKYGYIIDVFKYGQLIDTKYNELDYPLSNSIIGISPKGNVLFMKGSDLNFKFYEVKRQW